MTRMQFKPSKSLSRNIPRASFEYEVSEDNIIQIIDLDRGKTVTNDIEQVLRDIAQEQNHPLTGHEVVYRDTDGSWTGVELTANGTFGRFYALNVTSQEQAVARVRQMRAEAA